LHLSFTKKEMDGRTCLDQGGEKKNIFCRIGSVRVKEKQQNANNPLIKKKREDHWHVIGKKEGEGKEDDDIP